MTNASAWVGSSRPTETEFKELCRAAKAACERGVSSFDFERVADPERTERHVVEELTFAIEKVIDAARDLDLALTRSLEGVLPVERIVDVDVVEGGPF